MVPLPNEIRPHVGARWLKVLVAGHLLYHVQHRLPVLLCDYALDDLFKQGVDRLFARIGKRQIPRVLNQPLQVHAGFLLHLFCPDRHAVGEDLHRAEAGVMLLPASEAEMGKGQIGNRVHNLLPEFVPVDDIQVLIG